MIPSAFGRFGERHPDRARLTAWRVPEGKRGFSWRREAIPWGIYWLVFFGFAWIGQAASSRNPGAVFVFGPFAFLILLAGVLLFLRTLYRFITRS